MRTGSCNSHASSASRVNVTPSEVAKTIKNVASRLRQRYQEAVRFILRKGWRLILHPDHIELLYDNRPPTAEEEERLDPFYEDFARRLRKPPGWPATVPLPTWWSDIALGFHILEARPTSCPCGFPVVVLVYFETGPRWHCPACGRKVEDSSA